LLGLLHNIMIVNILIHLGFRPEDENPH